MADPQDLAALQKLLQSQPQKQGDPVVPQTQQAEAPQVTESAGPTPEEIVAMEEKQAAKEKKQIEEQIQKMKTEIPKTPQYQAMIDQKAAEKKEDQEERREERSKMVFQLKRLDK